MPLQQPLLPADAVPAPSERCRRAGRQAAGQMGDSWSRVADLTGPGTQAGGVQAGLGALKLTGDWRVTALLL